VNYNITIIESTHLFTSALCYLFLLLPNSHNLTNLSNCIWSPETVNDNNAIKTTAEVTGMK